MYRTSDIWWSSLETCSNLFILGPPTPTVLTYGGDTEACMVAKRQLGLDSYHRPLFHFIFTSERARIIFQSSLAIPGAVTATRAI